MHPAATEFGGELVESLDRCVSTARASAIGPAGWILELHPTAQPGGSTGGSELVPAIEAAHDEPRIRVPPRERRLVRACSKAGGKATARIILALGA